MQIDYTQYEAEHQLKLPMETDIFIAAENPVRLVSAVVERINLRGEPYLCSTLRKVFIFTPAIALIKDSYPHSRKNEREAASQ